MDVPGRFRGKHKRAVKRVPLGAEDDRPLNLELPSLRALPLFRVFEVGPARMVWQNEVPSTLKQI